MANFRRMVPASSYRSAGTTKTNPRTNSERRRRRRRRRGRRRRRDTRTNTW